MDDQVWSNNSLFQVLSRLFSISTTTVTTHRSLAQPVTTVVHCRGTRKDAKRRPSPTNGRHAQSRQSPESRTASSAAPTCTHCPMVSLGKKTVSCHRADEGLACMHNLPHVDMEHPQSTTVHRAEGLSTVNFYPRNTSSTVVSLYHYAHGAVRADSRRWVHPAHSIVFSSPFLRSAGPSMPVLMLARPVLSSLSSRGFSSEGARLRHHVCCSLREPRNDAGPLCRCIVQSADCKLQQSASASSTAGCLLLRTAFDPPRSSFPRDRVVFRRRSGRPARSIIARLSACLWACNVERRSRDQVYTVGAQNSHGI